MSRQPVDRSLSRPEVRYRARPMRDGVTIEYPIFPMLTRPNYILDDVAENHALWYFLSIAHMQLRRIEKDLNYEIDGITEESQLAARRVRDEFKRVADMTAALYGCPLDAIFESGRVRSILRFAIRNKSQVNERIEQWIKSGGNPEWTPQQGSYWK